MPLYLNVCALENDKITFYCSLFHETITTATRPFYLQCIHCTLIYKNVYAIRQERDKSL